MKIYKKEKITLYAALKYAAKGYVIRPKYDSKFLCAFYKGSFVSITGAYMITSRIFIAEKESVIGYSIPMTNQASLMKDKDWYVLNNKTLEVN